MIEGLKLTFTGEELRTLLAERATAHNRAAAYWQRQQSRTPESAAQDEPLLPEHMCTFEMEREKWRVEMLEFIGDHVEPHETYRLDAADLEFGDLLPPKPGSVPHECYEGLGEVGSRLVTRSPEQQRWKWVRDDEASRELGAQVDRLEIDEDSDPVRVDGPDQSE